MSYNTENILVQSLVIIKLKKKNQSKKLSLKTKICHLSPITSNYKKEKKNHFNVPSHQKGGASISFKGKIFVTW